MLLFADNFNFKKENFQSLYDYLDGEKIKYSYDSEHETLKKAWGDYQNFSIENKAIDNSDYDLNEIVKDEFLSSNIGRSDILSGDLSGESEIFHELQNSFFSDYKLCLSVADFWVTYWRKKLADTRASVVIVFGGNLIYAKSLLKVAELMGVRCFVVEHFYTGNDFYFEERYTAIPNNSLIKSKRFLKKLDKDDFDFWKKIQNQRNKNVKQPAYGSLLVENYVLLLAQVPNDFSIFSEANPYKNTIAFYKAAINEILEKTNKNVVIKVHPYERLKNPSAIINTYDELRKMSYLMSNEKSSRIHIYEDYSLEGLILGCDFAVTINSQSGLDVVRLGKNVCCFGNPFYGKKGFTLDFSKISDISELKLCDINRVQVLNNFLEFMSAAFVHLVGQGEAYKIQNALAGASLPKGVPGNIAIKANPAPLVKSAPAPKQNQTQTAVSSKTAVANKKVPVDNDKRRRLMKKFQDNPKRFFEDSKFAAFRFIGKII